MLDGFRNTGKNPARTVSQKYLAAAAEQGFCFLILLIVDSFLFFPLAQSHIFLGLQRQKALIGRTDDLIYID